MKTKSELKAFWGKHNLSCKNAYSPSYIAKLTEELGLVFDESLIYTKQKYREMADNRPRVDAEEWLKWVCNKFNITPDQGRLEASVGVFGEGSRRQIVEEAYFLEPTPLPLIKGNDTEPTPLPLINGSDIPATPLPTVTQSNSKETKYSCKACGSKLIKTNKVLYCSDVNCVNADLPMTKKGMPEKDTND